MTAVKEPQSSEEEVNFRTVCPGLVAMYTRCHDHVCTRQLQENQPKVWGALPGMGAIWPGTLHILMPRPWTSLQADVQSGHALLLTHFVHRS